MIDHEGVNFTGWFGNLASVGAIVSTFAGWAPPIAATIAFIWYTIQIYESATVQTWLRNRRTRKIAHMKAAVLLMEAQNKGQLPGPGDDEDEKKY